MPDLHPFPGLRYADASALSRLAAPPYDVIDETEREHLETLHPDNAVRLILPRDRTGGDRYSVAAATLRRWQDDGVLVRDRAPSLTVVRMRFSDAEGRPRSTIGVVGALDLPAGDDGGILPHERTLPKAKSDRLALLEATRANLDPIWGLSLTAGLSALLDLDRAPDGTCRVDGETHEAWTLDDPDRIAAVRAAVARSPIVLADGHHRFETATRYRDEHPDDAGAGTVMAYVVELADEQLSIEAIHRVLRLPAGIDVRRALEPSFEIVDAGPNDPDALATLEHRCGTERTIGLVDDRGLALARPRDGARAATAAQWPDAVASTDAALVESAARPHLDGAEWEYRAGARTVAGLVRSGTADAALLLQPVSVTQTRAVAEARERMPQKTTYFRPKPRTGFVFRTFD